MWALVGSYVSHEADAETAQVTSPFSCAETLLEGMNAFPFPVSMLWIVSYVPPTISTSPRTA